MQVLVRDNNVDQALKALKKKMQREGIFREMKLRGHYEKPSERKAREKAEAIRRARKLARKRLQREGLLPMKPKPTTTDAAAPGRSGPPRAAALRLRYGADFADGAGAWPAPLFWRDVSPGYSVAPCDLPLARAGGAAVPRAADAWIKTWSEAKRQGRGLTRRIGALALSLACDRWRWPAAHRSAVCRHPKRTTRALRTSQSNLTSLSAVVEKHPDDPQAYNMRGSVLAEAGQPEEALADFNKAISLDPNYAQAYANRALLYRQTGKLDLALADYNKALSIDGSYAPAVSRPRHRLPPAGPQHAGARRLEQGHRAQARQCAGLLSARPALSEPASVPIRHRRFLHRAWGLPRTRPSRTWRGRSAIWRSATPNRRRAILTTRCRSIRNLQAWTSRGLAYERLGQKDKAAGSYAKALNINEKYEVARAGFARVGGKVGQSYQTF